MTEEVHAFEQVVTSMAAFVVGRQPLGETLQRVAELARDAVPGADHASVTTLRDEQPETAVATDASVVELDQTQYVAGHGPCLDAFRSGKPMYMASAADDLRWPDFGREAARRGIHSTLALPLLLDDDSIGALNLYGDRPDGFSEVDQGLAARFTVPAAALVANALLFWEARELAENLRTALASRAVIEQAKGILMGQQRIDEVAAFDLLRRASQRENVKLRDVAQRLVDRTCRPVAPA